MRKEGLEPHDHDRGGEKGFNYMGPGFTSTPKGRAMKAFFLEKKDPETASRFHLSSMEFHLGCNPEALCVVTEFPLFKVRPSARNGVPENYLELKRELEKMGAKQRPKEDEVNRLVSRYDIQPLPLGKAMRLQRYSIRLAMKLADDYHGNSQK